jgi:membrane dipeptidase
VPLRLVDLHCNWLWQYATTTTGFEPSAYGEMPARQGQLDGYLSGTTAAVLTCGRTDADWARQGDPWRSLTDVIARYESEFTGRLLIDRADVVRWNAEPLDALCWGTLAVAGLDHVIREHADLDRLSTLFNRGVRVFQLVEHGSSVLGGSADPGDDRGLTDLGKAVVVRLAEVAAGSDLGPRPMIDLAGLNCRSLKDVLDSSEEAAAAGRLFVLYSHGAIANPGVDGSPGLGQDNLVRLRAAGGVIGLTPAPPYHRTTEELKASIEHAAAVPFEGRAGWKGIAIGTNFLAIASTAAGLGNVAQIKTWILSTFGPEAATALIAENARRLLIRAAGGEDHS